MEPQKTAAQDEKDLSWADKKEAEKNLRRVQNTVKKEEQEIERFEKEIAAMDTAFATAGYVPSQDDFEKYKHLKQSLEDHMARWEKAQEELDGLQNT